MTDNDLFSQHWSAFPVRITEDALDVLELLEDDPDYKVVVEASLLDLSIVSLMVYPRSVAARNILLEAVS